MIFGGCDADATLTNKSRKTVSLADNFWKYLMGELTSFRDQKRGDPGCHRLPQTTEDVRFPSRIVRSAVVGQQGTEKQCNENHA